MCIQRCTSVAVWTTSLVISVAAWTPSSVHTALHFSVCAVWTTGLVTPVTVWTPSSVHTPPHFSCCLDYKFSHINRCLDTIKCTNSAALQWLFGLQV
ncbi:hypothetical protein TNCV_2852681 [Trichonephila clavipes]|uniref:Secreted protein n=1 Tax=Trichonephila clavipes TaxID=2585209 RepID=A0A8X6UZ68_TRICX|nr:hypothetical protein TNCV_2852681 [Trichonephila clavipes]